MARAFWGVFVWRELKGASKGAHLLLALMFVCFVVGTRRAKSCEGELAMASWWHDNRAACRRSFPFGMHLEAQNLPARCRIFPTGGLDAVLLTRLTIAKV